MRSFFLLATIVALSACSRSSEASHEPARDTSAEPAPAPKPPPQPLDPRRVIVVVGDSISAGYGLPDGQSYPDDLQHDLDAEHLPYHVVNQGISGDTTEGGAARIDSAVAFHPFMVILELGGNDGLRGMPVKATRANLEKMILAFQAAGAKVVLAGMTLPPNYGPDYIRDFQKVYKDLAKKYDLIFIPFIMQDIITKDLRYIQPDGIHPTAPGSQIVAKTVLKTIRPYLK